MIVTLKPGEKLHIELFESDGGFVFEFNEDNIRITSDFADTSGRVGEIYREEFNNGDLRNSDDVEVPSESLDEDAGGGWK